MSLVTWSQNGLLAAVSFAIVADAEPGLLPRLLQPFAKRDLIPDHFSATRMGGMLRVEIALHEVPAEVVHLIEGNLRQVVGVSSVVRRQEISGCVQRRAA